MITLEIKIWIFALIALFLSLILLPILKQWEGSIYPVFAVCCPILSYFTSAYVTHLTRYNHCCFKWSVFSNTCLYSQVFFLFFTLSSCFVLSSWGIFLWFEEPLSICLILWVAFNVLTLLFLSWTCLYFIFLLCIQF